MTRRRLNTLMILAALAAAIPTSAAEAPAAPAARVGVLLVNHGSRSAAWRATLLQVERAVRDPILGAGLAGDVRTAFMEYTEPSIATSLKALDREGFTDVILIPVFLTVSTHTFDDIPTIVGRKADPHSLEALRLEGIERYTPRARVHVGPRLDFTHLLRDNVLARVRKLSRDPAREGLVLVAYGDETYERQWTGLLDSVAAHVRGQAGPAVSSHAWVGHVVRYDASHTTRAIERVLAERERAIVVPVLVAFDEMFQVDIIGRGVAAVRDHRARVAYVPDAILPDEGINRWIVETVRRMAREIGPGRSAAAR